MWKGQICSGLQRNLYFFKRNIKIWNKFNFGHIFQDKDVVSDQFLTIQDTIQKEGYNEHLKIFKMSLLLDLHNIISREENF